MTLVAVATFASACRSRHAATSAADARADAAVPSVDSELAVFRSGMRARPSALAGVPTQDSLIRLFERALAKRDTAVLDRLQLTREEFAYLYYPDSKMSRPPYELGPDVMWMQIKSQSDKGVRRLVAKYGGTRLRIAGLECQPPDRQSAVVIHECGVRMKQSPDSTVKQLFGSIIERDGRFKFVGYANRL
ncbi:MAG TPA: hypothetical protein VD771_08115 [Gemmatimonadaceae bacterium]|nr:hypothetical protein [Gemmatimonadaceae bacterium]